MKLTYRLSDKQTEIKQEVETNARLRNELEKTCHDTSYIYEQNGGSYKRYLKTRFKGHGTNKGYTSLMLQCWNESREHYSDEQLDAAAVQLLENQPFPPPPPLELQPKIRWIMFCLIHQSPKLRRSKRLKGMTRLSYNTYGTGAAPAERRGDFRVLLSDRPHVRLSL